MSTLNIGFYDEISELIPFLSSNIIKYAPYVYRHYRLDLSESDKNNYFLSLGLGVYHQAPFT